MTKFFNSILFGIFSSILIVGVGLFLTNTLNQGFFVSASAFIIPIFGIYFHKSSKKQLGLGMLIVSIPLLLIGLFLIFIGKLH